MAENPDGQNIVTDPTSKQPDFDLPRQILGTLNRLWLVVRPGKVQSHDVQTETTYYTSSCDDGYETQIITHIISTKCPIRAFKGILNDTHIQLIGMQLIGYEI